MGMTWKQCDVRKKKNNAEYREDGCKAGALNALTFHTQTKHIIRIFSSRPNGTFHCEMKEGWMFLSFKIIRGQSETLETL